MRTVSLVFALSLTLAAGCGGDQSSEPSPDGGSTSTPASVANGGAPAAGAAADAIPVAINGGVAVIDESNTSIGFVGTKPDGSHTGGFGEFSGQVRVDEASGVVEGISVEIQTESLWSDNERLTGHLKTPDFFNVREYPTLTFESTGIDGEGSDLTVHGNLTMLDTTKEVSFPASATVENGTLALSSEFTIDRTEFGMNYQPDQISPDVAITVAVGTKPSASSPNGDAQEITRGGSGRGPGLGRRDPARFFSQRDANGDGKLSGDELPERMRDNLDQIDQDGDGAVSLEEFQQNRPQFGGRGGPRASDGGSARSSPPETP